MVEIGRTGAKPNVVADANVTDAGSAAQAKATQSAPTDSVGRAEAAATPTAGELPPVSAPNINLDVDDAEGFAYQLGNLMDSMDGKDLLAAFLKLRVFEERDDAQFQDDLDSALSVLRKLAIQMARKLIENANVNYETWLALKNSIEATEAAQSKILARLEEMLQERVRDNIEGAMDGDDNKSKDQEKRLRKLQKSSTQKAAAGAEVEAAFAKSITAQQDNPTAMPLPELPLPDVPSDGKLPDPEAMRELLDEMLKRRASSERAPEAETEAEAEPAATVPERPIEAPKSERTLTPMELGQKVMALAGAKIESDEDLAKITERVRDALDWMADQQADLKDFAQRHRTIS